MGKVNDMEAPTERPTLDLREIYHERKAGVTKTAVAAGRLTEAIAKLRRSHPDLAADHALRTLEVWANAYASEIHSHIQVPVHKSYEAEFETLCSELLKWGNKPGNDGSARCAVLLV